MAAPCSRESHLELQAVEMTAPLTQWVGTTSRAPTGGRVPSWGNLITN